jgi:superfamily II DNA or RNA helicase
MSTARGIPSMKPGKVAELAAVEVVCNGCQVLVWTVFDEETNLIMQAFDGVTAQPPNLRLPSWQGCDLPFCVRALTGKTRAEDRENILRDFKRGEIDVLVSNARMLGFGQNLQMAGAMIISGWNDSFEQLYQLIRRSVRYGQTKVVRIHIPIVPELEQAQWDNLQRKQKQFDEQAAMQERYYKEAMA